MHCALASLVVPWSITLLALTYTLYLNCKLKSKVDEDKSKLVNPNKKKDCLKVIDTFDIEDLESKTVLCRCWRSEKFPLCDGAHAKYNLATGDNLGPVIIQKKN